MKKNRPDIEKVKQEVEANAIAKGVITQEEMDRIREQRQFDEFTAEDKDSLSWKIAVANDSLRRLIDSKKFIIKNELAEIKNRSARKDKLKVQLLSGTIIEELKPGIPLNKGEVEYEIEKLDNLIEGTVKDLIPKLANLRMLVGNLDVLGKVIMSLKDFDEFVYDIISRLEKNGCKLSI